MRVGILDRKTEAWKETGMVVNFMVLKSTLPIPADTLGNLIHSGLHQKVLQNTCLKGSFLHRGNREGSLVWYFSPKHTSGEVHTEHLIELLCQVAAHRGLNHGDLG